MKKSGFTLIELLVVVAIMAIVAVAFIINFGSFDEDANLKNVAFDIRSYLRLAQANAQSGVKCVDGTGGVGWSIVINNKDKDAIHLRCGSNLDNERTWSATFPAYIYGIEGSYHCDSSFAHDVAGVVTVKFAYLSGKVSFEDGDTTNNCLKNSGIMAIALRKKLDSPDFKTVTITKGGSVDVE